MFEKVSPSHPDKIADRIAGAIVDLAYAKEDNPKVAVEVLIGHGKCHIINETSVKLSITDINKIVKRIAKEEVEVDYQEVPQDPILASNQEKFIRCGDNGIFHGVPIKSEEKYLTSIVRDLYTKYPSDSKFIYDEEDNKLIVCQSNVNSVDLMNYLNARYSDIKTVIINPLGDWTGGINVDSGATNRKLGSDMGRAVTGGGINGKDCSKSDVSVNIVCHLLAQQNQTNIYSYCAIGNDSLKFTLSNGNHFVLEYDDVVQRAKAYISGLGGFEKLAEWGLI